MAFQILVALLQLVYCNRGQAARESLLAYLIVEREPEQKALIAKRAAEHGVVALYHRFYLKRTWHCDPLPIRADSHENITANETMIHEIITPRKICVIR